jgi:cyanophycinase
MAYRAATCWSPGFFTKNKSMTINKIFALAFCALVAFGCKKNELRNPAETGGGGTTPATPRPASIGYVGDTADTKPTVKSGVVMMGGGADVDAAIRWMIDRSGGGNAVIIRATGTDAYNSYMKGLGTLQSVETLLINSRDLANNATVAQIIKNAELLFIAGGDQSDYTNYWKGTKTADAINYLLTEKKAPVGGTSAGCAILGQLYYSGENGSVTSAEAIANPYRSTVTLYKDDFLKANFLQNVITDQHYITRTRQGRNRVFLARSIKDWGIYAKGISMDERSAVCMDENGNAKVIGSGKAYFLTTQTGKAPETCELGKPLVWQSELKAVKAYEITGTSAGAGNFSISDFDATKATGGKWYWWWVEGGEWKFSDM